MSKKFIITIDGPAASGKTTVGKRLADERELLFFDTGIMYRAVTWAVLDRKTDINDESSVVDLAEKITIDIHPPTVDDGRDSDILVDGEDITWQIRSSNVDKNVSRVSAYKGVRDALTIQQRRIGLKGDIVMVGRDIGTVVLPDAELKIYLDASAEERARRRYLESVERGEDVSQEDILTSMINRDLIDSTREVAPLKPAPDAHVIDTDKKNLEEVLEEIRDIID